MMQRMISKSLDGSEPSSSSSDIRHGLHLFWCGVHGELCEACGKFVASGLNLRSANVESAIQPRSLIGQLTTTFVLVRSSCLCRGNKKDNNHPTNIFPSDDTPFFRLKRVIKFFFSLLYLLKPSVNMAAVQTAGGGAFRTAFRVGKFVLKLWIVPADENFIGQGEATSGPHFQYCRC
jgi:hypothetical protein